MCVDGGFESLANMAAPHQAMIVLRVRMKVRVKVE